MLDEGDSCVSLAHALECGPCFPLALALQSEHARLRRVIVANGRLLVQCVSLILLLVRHALSGVELFLELIGQCGKLTLGQRLDEFESGTLALLLANQRNQVVSDLTGLSGRNSVLKTGRDRATSVSAGQVKDLGANALA